MTEFETRLLASLTAMSEQQADTAEGLARLTASYSQTTQALATISAQQAAILAVLSKEPSGESLKDTMAALLAPLDANLKGLVASFNTLASISSTLSAQLPPPPTR